MYARVLTSQVPPDKVEEVTRRWQEEVLPVAKQQQGLKDILLLVDPSAGRSMAISLWETEEARTAYEQSPVFQELASKFADVVSEPPSVQQYEVRVQA